MNAALQKELFDAIENSDFSKIKDLVHFGADINQANEDGETPLARVCSNMEYKAMKDVIHYFISKGADVNKYETGGFTPLFNAILANRVEVVLLLLERGANPNINFFPEENPDLVSSALDLAYYRYLDAVVRQRKGFYNDPDEVYYEVISARNIMYLLIEAGARLTENEVVPENS
jgi:ankyrin repeat protein